MGRHLAASRAVRGVVLVPDSGRDDLADTVDSALSYLEDVQVVVVDDRHAPAGPHLLGAPCTVLPALPYPHNLLGGLWAKEAYGLTYVLANWSPRYILRMDSDALVIGPGLDDAVLARLAADPACGLLGAYRQGPDGGLRDFGPAGLAVQREAGWAGLAHLRAWQHVVGYRLFRQMVASARRFGYVPGEHALGALTALRPAMVRTWYEKGWLSPRLAYLHMADDWVLGLATRAAGYTLGDLSGPEGPVAVKWKGLPASPDQLVANGALATHSVRSYPGWTEKEIRAFFAARRPGRVPP